MTARRLRAERARTPTSPRCPTWPRGRSAAAWSRANDELFAERENLIRPEPPASHRDLRAQGQGLRRLGDPAAPRARRTTRRSSGSAPPGSSRGVVVDTASSRGNYPPDASVEAPASRATRPPTELAGRRLGDRWCRGRRSRATARTRSRSSRPAPVHPRPADDLPRRRGRPAAGARRAGARPAAARRGTVDLAALENGGGVVDCSDMFYSSPRNLLCPAGPGSMGEGWENARRRDDGNDWVDGAAGRARAGRAGRGRHVVLRRQRARLGLGARRRRAPADRPSDAWTLLPRTRLQPDTRHLFRVGEPDAGDARAAGRLPRRRRGPAAASRGPSRRRTGRPGCSASSTCCRRRTRSRCSSSTVGSPEPRRRRRSAARPFTGTDRLPRGGRPRLLG